MGDFFFIIFILLNYIYSIYGIIWYYYLWYYTIYGKQQEFMRHGI